MKELTKLKNLMINVCKTGVILNPSFTRIKAISQKFDDCYNIVKKYDTRETIDRNGEYINKLEKDEIDALRRQDQTATHNSSLDKEEIWNRPEVIKGINSFSEYVVKYNPDSKKVLAAEYRVIDPNILRHKTQIRQDYRLYKGCFKNDLPDFALLECILEYMNNLLCKCGYQRDKDMRKTKSGIHDVSHSIYATYCNYFVTLDNKLRKRTDAIYNFLGIETEVLSMDDFINR